MNLNMKNYLEVSKTMKEDEKMFGNELLNARQITKKLEISSTYFFKLTKLGMPFHRVTPRGRKFYNYDEVVDWIRNR